MMVYVFALCCVVYVLCMFVAGVMIRSCSSCPRYQSTTDTGEAAENFVGRNFV